MAPKRRKKGDRRIDVAIDHFAPMGYTAQQVRTAVNALLKQQEPAVDEVPPQSNSSILEGHSAESAAIMSSDEEVEDPMLIEPHALEVIAPVAETKATVPRFEATVTGETKTRPPCYGWLSESEDEEEQTSEQLPNPGLICKRKWLE